MSYTSLLAIALTVVLVGIGGYTAALLVRIARLRQKLAGRGDKGGT